MTYLIIILAAMAGIAFYMWKTGMFEGIRSNIWGGIGILTEVLNYFNSFPWAQYLPEGKTFWISLGAGVLFVFFTALKRGRGKDANYEPYDPTVGGRG